ncbi:MAG TPA: serine/threonine-protein kinase, partial [Gemmatimonadaceae bacterium]
MRNTATGGRTDGEADGHDARLRTLFMAAVDLAAADRAAFLADACGDDDTLRGELEALLAALDDARTDALLPPLFPEAALPDAPGPDTLDDLAVGQPVGPYRIVRRIAEGGMGTVYLAERDDIGRRVALKLVRHGRLASPEQLRRFLLERQILARLEHPGIARLLDAGMTEQQLPYLVMEYVEGVPLDRHCDERRLPIDQRLALFARVCEAVQAAHEAHVVHRDLKPSNILVTATGEPRLLDFGIAKLLDDAGAGEVGLTRPGSPLATPEYASPEQLRGQPVSVASDVYSLGVILYELLTGWRPEPAGHSRGANEHAGEASGPPPPSAVVRRAARGMERVERVAPWPIAAVRGTVPDRLVRRLAGDLDRIVLQALQAEPTRRYASVAALRADLVRHLTGRPVQAAADTLLERVRRWHGRRRAPRAALGTAVAILALVTALAGAIAAGLPGAWRTAPDDAAPAAPAGADGATVLVLPFGVQGERSQPGVGPALTELVARGLDGLGDLRGVEPRVAGELVAGAGPMATPAGGRRLAARAGARLYVVGDVTLAGGRLRTTAALYDR